MKKVCFLVSNNFTSDNRTMRQAEALAGAGYSVKIICTKSDQTLPSQETRNGIVISRVLDGWLPTVPRSRKEFRLAKSYMRYATCEKADIYVAKDLDTLVYGWQASKENKAKLVYNADEYWQDLTLAGLSWKSRVYYKFVFFFLERFLARRADLVITVNEHLGNLMKKTLGLKILPTVIKNAPEPVKIVANNDLEEESGFIGKDIVVYVGIFSEGRGLEDLIKSAQYLDDNVRVVIRGYGNKEDILRNLISELNLEDRVRLMEAVPYERLISHIAPAKLGIIPTLPVSTSYKYSLPNKFFEYILAGLPICSSSLPVIHDLIEKYQIGATYEPGSPKAMAESINAMLKDKERYQIYKKNVLKAAKELNWDVEKQKYLTAIKGL